MMMTTSAAAADGARCRRRPPGRRRSRPPPRSARRSGGRSRGPRPPSGAGGRAARRPRLRAAAMRGHQPADAPQEQDGRRPGSGRPARGGRPTRQAEHRGGRTGHGYDAMGVSDSASSTSVAAGKGPLTVWSTAPSRQKTCGRDRRADPERRRDAVRRRPDGRQRARTPRRTGRLASRAPPDARWVSSIALPAACVDRRDRSGRAGSSPPPPWSPSGAPSLTRRSGAAREDGATAAPAT